MVYSNYNYLLNKKQHFNFNFRMQIPSGTLVTVGRKNFIFNF